MDVWAGAPFPRRPKDHYVRANVLKCLEPIYINHCHERTFDLDHYHHLHDTWAFVPKARDDCIRDGYSAYLFDCNIFLIQFNGFQGSTMSILTL